LEFLQLKDDKNRHKLDMLGIENKKLDEEKKNIMRRLEFETEKSLGIIIYIIITIVLIIINCY
jgi:hypothetical protein